MKKNYKKSDLNINVEDDIDIIMYSKKYLLNCELKVSTLENIQLEFDSKNHINLDSERQVLNKLEKLRIVYDLSLKIQNEKYLEYSLDPKNLFLDRSLNAKIFERKISKEENIKEIQLKRIKALLGSLFLKASYDKLLANGLHQMSKKKTLKEYYDANTMEQFIDTLNYDILELKKIYSKEKILVDSYKYDNLKRKRIGLKVFTVFLCIVIIWELLYMTPFKNSEKNAYIAYAKDDYTAVIDSISGYKTKRLTNDDKLILCISTIKTENLTDDQKNNILVGINTETDEDVLDYWIYIGQGNYDEAYNLSLSIGDIDLQEYALIRKLDTIKNDDTLDSETRSSQMTTLQGQIDAIETSKKEEEKKMQEVQTQEKTTTIESNNDDKSLV